MELLLLSEELEPLVNHAGVDFAAAFLVEGDEEISCVRVCEEDGILGVEGGQFEADWADGDEVEGFFVFGEVVRVDPGGESARSWLVVVSCAEVVLGIWVYHFCDLIVFLGS